MGQEAYLGSHPDQAGIGGKEFDLRRQPPGREISSASMRAANSPRAMAIPESCADPTPEPLLPDNSNSGVSKLRKIGSSVIR